MIRCRDQCGSSVEARNKEEDDQMAALGQSWSQMNFGGGYRCPTCIRALTHAASLVGTAESMVEYTPVTSEGRGALAKATADTILPPAVRP